jgi:hypothetical protein
MNLILTTHEATLLKTALDQHLVQLDRDLVRTDKHDLQHALARDIDQLRSIDQRLETALRG